MADLKSIREAIDRDLQIVRGDSGTWENTVLDIEDSEAVDITGGEMTFTVKEKIEDNDALITKTESDGIVINSDQVNNKGKYQFSLIPADIKDLDYIIYQYEIKLLLGGKTNRILRGNLEILDGTTG